MQFHVPQYIDIEDKLFGPLTLKQGIYLAGGVGSAYVVYRLFSSYLFITAPLIFGIGVLTWALAFYPKEKLGKPFIEILEAAFHYALRDKLYTWKKVPKVPKIGTEEVFVSSYQKESQAPKASVSSSIPSGKLSSLSLGLDTRNAPKMMSGKQQ